MEQISVGSESWFLKKGKTVLLIGDATVISKAGKKTYGLGRFFSSLSGKPIRGLEFEALSVVDFETRQAYPVRMEQIVKEKEVEKEEAKPKKGGKKGRPKGSKNKNRKEVMFSSKQEKMKKWIISTKKLLEETGVKVEHFVYDARLATIPVCSWYVNADCI